VTLLLAVTLLLVAASGATVLLTRSPLAQAVVLSVHGLVLTVAFVAIGAADVALAQLAVGAAVVPLMVLLALAKTRNRREPSANARPRLTRDEAAREVE
jgi:energy-converting hydrogenase B subunit D